MRAILTWIGYDPSRAAISQSYAIIAVANNMFDSAMGLIDCILDIEGHAKFTAVFEFWDSLASTGLAFYFVKTCRPSLWQLGLFHLASDVITTAIYFIMTGYFKCWFSEYREGLRAPMSSVVSYVFVLISVRHAICLILHLPFLTLVIAPLCRE